MRHLLAIIIRICSKHDMFVKALRLARLKMLFDLLKTNAWDECNASCSLHAKGLVILNVFNSEAPFYSRYCRLYRKCVASLASMSEKAPPETKTCRHM